MTAEKPRLSRLAAILTQLQSKRVLTAREIAEIHGVSIRTVYRDIRALEQSGVPILMEEGKGYSLVDGYRLPPVSFTEEEANALITSEQLILKNKDSSLARHYQSAVTKVKATLRTKQKNKIELLADRIQVRTNTASNNTSDYLIELQSTIANYRLIKIDYLSLKNERTSRTLEPFALYTSKENWVLIAFCRERNDFRAFRLDCIERLVTTTEYFDPHNITLEQYLESCRKKWSDTPDTGLSAG